MTENLQETLTFIVENQRFAIRLQAVNRVIRAVAVTKLTDSPGFIEGVIDYFGEIIAVINMRKRLGYRLQEIKSSDRFIIANTAHRKISLIVDQVENVMLPDSQDLYESKDLDKSLELFAVLLGEAENISDEDAELWQLETESTLTIHRFEGAHFFIFNQTENVCRLIAEKCFNQ